MRYEHQPETESSWLISWTRRRGHCGGGGGTWKKRRESEENKGSVSVGPPSASGLKGKRLGGHPIQGEPTFSGGRREKKRLSGKRRGTVKKLPCRPPLVRGIRQIKFLLTGVKPTRREG